MATGSEIRVGDADRDATATQLREHYAAGRLTLDELNERLEQTFAARTGADLNGVMRDLPSLDGAWARAGQSAADSSLGAPLLRNDQGQQDQGQWDQGQWDQGGRRHRYSAFGTLVPVVLAIWALLLLGGAFGFGGGRPLAVVLLLAVVAMIRRMFGGRRRSGRPYGRGCGWRW
jgi:Domain of unknown function (DUF1707)